MSRHSKWAKIKREKQSSDIKKGALFTKLSRAITAASREGGQDPSSNLALKIAIENAKNNNMAKKTILRAIEKGRTGGLQDRFEEISYEAVGKDGAGILIDCHVSSRTSIVSQVRNKLKEYGLKINQGSLAWRFESFGQIVVSDINEDILLRIVAIPGVLDFEQIDSRTYVYTPVKELSSVIRGMEELSLEVKGRGIVKRPKIKIELDSAYRKELGKLVIELKEINGVANIWTNFS